MGCTFSHSLDLCYNCIGLYFCIPRLVNWWFSILRLRHFEISNILALHGRHIGTYKPTMSFSGWRVLDARIRTHRHRWGIILGIKILHRLRLIIWHFGMGECRFVCPICLLAIHCLIQVDGHVLVHGLLSLSEGAWIATLNLVCLTLWLNLNCWQWLTFGLLRQLRHASRFIWVLCTILSLIK